MTTYDPNSLFGHGIEIEKIKKQIEMMDVEIESLIISGDMKLEIIEALDNIGVIIYKLYNTIKGMIEE